ncbi:MAG TPA: flagellar FlbD family protein [Tepiditoga sp.]|nr:flagellar FlbD family protein [Tepiditoga sp.]
MVMVSKLNGEKFFINELQIEKVEIKPDTTITMMNGHVYIIKDDVNDLLDNIKKNGIKLSYSERGEL